MTVFSAIVLFGFLIFVHELGHFVTAKLNGVKVLKFSLGFGPKLFGRRIGETEYLLSAVPLGGYVKMLGEDVEDDTEPSEYEPGRAYQEKSVLSRAAIIVAGPLCNILTAVVVFFFVYLIGVPTLLPVIGETLQDTPAARAGLVKGDIIVEIDNKEIKQWSEVTEIIHSSPNKRLIMKLQRQAVSGGKASELLSVELTPESKKSKNLFGEDTEIGLIGVKPSGETFEIKAAPAEAVIKAVHKTWELSVLTLLGMVKIIRQVIPADTIGGPILIFQMAEKQASEGALSFFTFAALISINLGVLNLLPIPVLDGGHILFLGIEAARKKPLSKQAVIISQKIGMVLLLMLMVFAMYNDIVRLITGKTIP